MAREVKIITGASYGDEGKGLAADRFCRAAQQQGLRCLTVLHNGGAQRGHTVVTADGWRHVYHHLAAGTKSGSDSYFADSFLLNPVVFAAECAEVQPETRLIYDPQCLWSTPYDMMLNQIAEDARGDKRHGSCGYGIWETIRRSQQFRVIRFPDFMQLSRVEQLQYLYDIRDRYLPMRLQQLGIAGLPEMWRDIVQDPALPERFLEDCAFFASRVQCAEAGILAQYPYLVFEGAQGLLLSQRHTEWQAHTTPSFTGAENPVRLLQTLQDDSRIEVCYITRSYLTRHGAGPFPTACDKADINPDMIDRTNMPNPYQGTLRYGRIDLPALQARIREDLAMYQCFEEITASAVVTHLNETGGCLCTTDGNVRPTAAALGVQRLYCAFDERDF